MSEGEGLLSGSLGVVLSDLFLASTSAILMLLVVLRDTPDIPVPIQADILLACLPNGEFLLSLPNVDDASQSLSGLQELGSAVLALSPSPRLFQSVALVPGSDGLSATCLNHAEKAVRRWNSSLGESARGANAVVLGLVAMPLVEKSEP